MLLLSDRNRELFSATSVLRTIASYILDADPSVLALLNDTRDVYLSQCRPNTRKSFEDTVTSLIATTNLKRVYLIIDGIDEMDRIEGPRLLEFLMRLAKSNGEVVRLLLSSRDISNIREHTSKVPQVVANVENAEDIELYVTTEKAILKKRFVLSDEEVDAMLKPLPPRSKGSFRMWRSLASEQATHLWVNFILGMFLFARLVIHSLNRQTCIAELREASRNIPEGLNEAYVKRNNCPIRKQKLCILIPPRSAMRGS